MDLTFVSLRNHDHAGFQKRNASFYIGNAVYDHVAGRTIADGTVESAGPMQTGAFTEFFNTEGMKGRSNGVAFISID